MGTALSCPFKNKKSLGVPLWRGALGSGIVTEVTEVTAAVQVQSLNQELLHDAGPAKKNKKQKGKKKKFHTALHIIFKIFTASTFTG